MSILTLHHFSSFLIFHAKVTIINSIKYMQSPGIGQIPAESIKAGGRTIFCAIHKLIISIWNKEELPEEWKESIIVPIYKKGTKQTVITIGAYHYWAGRSGIESRWGRDFPSVQTGPGAHPASCKMGAGSFQGVKCGRGVLLTTHPLLVPRSWKSRAIHLPTLWATPDL